MLCQVIAVELVEQFQAIGFAGLIDVFGKTGWPEIGDGDRCVGFDDNALMRGRQERGGKIAPLL